jgi:nucleoside-diphosphate-sugar epimerase
MNILILGCGVVGARVAALMSANGHQVVGVRRQAMEVAGVRMIAGDLADPGLYDRLSAEAFDGVLLSANPGLRRGRDNGLARGAAHAVVAFPRARVVYTGTSAVYADADGRDVAEDGAVAVADPAVAGLLAIEQAVLASPRALVLRCPALVGPTRVHARDRLLRGETTVRGNPDRPFTFLHEDDCAELCAAALGGSFGTGILNAAAPQRISVRDYYRALAPDIAIVGDGATVPSRGIDARRLHGMCPQRTWRGVEVSGGG